MNNLENKKSEGKSLKIAGREHTKTLESNIINTISTILFLGDLFPSSQLEYCREHFPNLLSSVFMPLLHCCEALWAKLERECTPIFVLLEGMGI